MLRLIEQFDPASFHLDPFNPRAIEDRAIEGRSRVEDDPP
jgi:hypothetical protein